MAGNHLEDLIAQWYEFSGYFVRRNVKVGPRERGGYECELDIVAFHPEKKEIIHIEPSLDADPWPKREQRFEKKFRAGRGHIPNLFNGIEIPDSIEQVAVLVFGSTANRPTLGGGRLRHVSDVLKEIADGLKGRKIQSAAVPEQFALLRTIQFVSQYRHLMWSSA